MENKADKLESLLVASDLPFKHYYSYGGKVVEVAGWTWQVDEWERIRKERKEKVII